MEQIKLNPESNFFKEEKDKLKSDWHFNHARRWIKLPASDVAKPLGGKTSKAKRLKALASKMRIAATSK